MAAFRTMLADDRRRAGFTVGQVAWRLGVSPATYREIEVLVHLLRVQRVGPTSSRPSSP